VTRRLATAIALTLLCLALLSACGGSSGVSGMGSGGGPPGDTATFTFSDGGTISVSQSGSIQVSGSASPALDYSGPLGCRGHYFSGDYSDHIGITARYSAVDAVMAIGQDVFHFAQPPTVKGGELAWTSTFDDGSGHAKRYGLRVRCPLPTDAPTPLLPLR
jgi:hypothetical protein